MGSFNFVKDAEEELWNTVTGQHGKDDQVKRVQEHLNKAGTPDADKANIQIADGKTTVTDDDLSQEAKGKILVVVGNVSGITSVDDQVKTAIPAAASQFYTVKSGDTLGTISKQVYGSADLYNKIFEANKPMLRSLGKIYPRQVLRILEEQLIASHRLLDNGNRCQQMLAYQLAGTHGIPRQHSFG